MATAQGPASGNGEFWLGQTVGLEVQVPNGLPSLCPSAAPYQADPQTAYSGTIVNKTVAGVVFAIPA